MIEVISKGADIKDKPFSTPYYRLLTAAEVAAKNAYLTGVFGWMAIGLVLTTAAAAGIYRLAPVIPPPTTISNLFLWVLILLAGASIVAFPLNWAIRRLTAAPALLFFVVYAIWIGVFFQFAGTIFAIGSQIIITSFVTACTFGIMALFGHITQRDLTRNSSIVFMILVGLGFSWAVNRFFAIAGFSWIATFIVILYFGALIFFETRYLNQMSLGVDENNLPTQFDAVIGALQLYIDFLLFIVKLLAYVIAFI